MKTIIAGSRTITELTPVLLAVKESGFEITEVISGGANGVDRLGEQCAALLNVPVRIFEADWFKFGKSAGYRRNVEMAKNADALIAVWDGKSKGTKHMIDIAKREGLRTYIHTIP